MSNSDFKDMNYLQEKLSESKYHQWLGLKVISYEKDILHVVLPFREEFFGTKEEINIHGGIISTLADAATCFVVMIQTGNDVPNLNLYMDYLRMAPGNTDLHAYSKVVKLGKTICVSEVEIKTEDHRHVASGRSVIMNNGPSRSDIVGGGRN